LRMVAPSLVTTTSCPRPMLCRILSCEERSCVNGRGAQDGEVRGGCIATVRTMPLGPSVVFTMSAMAMAPTKAACIGPSQ